MRLIGGRLKGLNLTAVGKGDAGAHLRPTTDRVRESLFNILEGGRFGDPISDVHVLDLFAGTGALGLEALSRGAGHVTFIESGHTSLGLLNKNIAKANVGSETTVLRCDARRLPKANSVSCKLVFLDPPYGADLGSAALEAARRQGWLAENALIVWEEATEIRSQPGFVLKETRRFGQTWLTFQTLADSSDDAC